MSEEIQWVLELNVHQGQQNNVRAFVADIVKTTQENEPGALCYEYHLSGDGNRCVVLERYADSTAALTHLENFETLYADRFFSLFELAQFRVFGPASDELRNLLGGLGATFEERIGGFRKI